MATLLSVGSAARPARAKNPEAPETTPRAGSEATFLDHAGLGRLWIGGEINSILQFHPAFPAAYSGDNSLQSGREAALSGLATLFLGAGVGPTTELIVDPEMALGGGLSRALGVAGFTNLDVVRNPSLSHAPYIGRAEIHQIIPLCGPWSDDGGWVDNDDRGPISSLRRVPRHRLELRFGKMSTADVFDVNPAGSDSHLQFMNWSVDNNGAFDYAADTRGYTLGLVLEYQGPLVEVRLGEMAMPKVANGIDLDYDLGKDRGENLEVELKYSRRADWAGTARVLGYLNHANMGNYAEANAAARASAIVPDVTASRQKGRRKIGVGLNLFQELGGGMRAFARLGWNDGRNESFAYTEIDDTVEIGGDLLGRAWRRPTDRAGLAVVSNGLSDAHAEYLRLGGHGFLLGDGDTARPRASSLDYARELIVEHYYDVHVWKGTFLAEDVQFIAHPGYNAARGPVWVFSLRGHLEF